MYSFEDTMIDQAQLSQLCADRELITNEICIWNAFYGIDHVIKLYAGIENASPLKVIVPHGIVFSDKVNVYEKYNRVPAILNFSKHRKLPYQKNTIKRIYDGNAPFSYVCNLLKNQPQPERRGTIFFLSHSSHYAIVKADIENIVQKLNFLDDRFKPVTICIYWKDYELGYHIPFKKNGYTIVSAGHMYDKHFLFRLYHLCSLHKYAASNSIGSNLFYSIEAGCSFFYFDAGEVKYDFLLETDKGFSSINYTDKLKTMFVVPQQSITPEQKKCAEDYLGLDHFLSPQELRSILNDAENYYFSSSWKVKSLLLSICSKLNAYQSRPFNT